MKFHIVDPAIKDKDQHRVHHTNQRYISQARIGDVHKAKESPELRVDTEEQHGEDDIANEHDKKKEVLVDGLFERLTEINSKNQHDGMDGIEHVLSRNERSLSVPSRIYGHLRVIPLVFGSSPVVYHNGQMTQSSQDDITPVNQLILKLQEVRTGLVDCLELGWLGQREENVQDDVLCHVSEDELEGTEVCALSLHDDKQWD